MDAETYERILAVKESRIAELEATIDAINGTSTLDLFFKALGWQGGTIHDVVETVRGQAQCIKEMREAIRQMAQANAWANFGECRGFTEGRLLDCREVDELARSVLARWPE